jgi:histidinol phosphatase-like enzyme
MKLGVFIERDGVLNQARVERNHQVSPLSLDEFHVNEAAAPLLKRLKNSGFVLIATTNQPGSPAVTSRVTNSTACTNC